MSLTGSRLEQLLTYAPETGLFYWKWREGTGAQLAGSIAGSIDKDGYRVIKLDQKIYRAHRLAWLWMTGSWPANEIDHADLNKDNNAFANLRDATKSQNMQNMPCRPVSATGVKGVQFDERRGRYYAKITAAGKKTWLGYHRNIEDAARAYASAANELHGKFARVA